MSLQSFKNLLKKLKEYEDNLFNNYNSFTFKNPLYCKGLIRGIEDLIEEFETADSIDPKEIEQEYFYVLNKIEKIFKKDNSEISQHILNYIQTNK
jgi:hypothetical protein